jgi:predicted amidohydrolase
MESLKLDLRTFDVGASAADPAAFARLVTDRIEESWNTGANIVVFPEFTWMGLERFVTGPDAIRGVADIFWNQLWPGIATSHSRPDKAAVLGTVPFVDEGGRMRNRAPILNSGQTLYQDKIHLTPWEGAFTGGGPVRVWDFRGLRVVVVICLDVEIPEISAALRGVDLDLMLVPSATESLAGVERVGRCAGARAVELGCHVGLCHLVGGLDSELVDENLGRLAVFSPSQSVFPAANRQVVSEVFKQGFHRMSASLDIAALRKNRADLAETDPSKIRPAPIRLES